jgi:hypothetical protein
VEANQDQSSIDTLSRDVLMAEKLCEFFVGLNSISTLISVSITTAVSTISIVAVNLHMHVVQVATSLCVLFKQKEGFHAKKGNEKYLANVDRSRKRSRSIEDNLLAVAKVVRYVLRERY